MLYSNLSIKERKGLCLAFAKRFSDTEDRELLLEQSGIEWPHAFSWDVLLYSISEHPQVMHEFLATARKMTRKDQYFQEILYLIEPAEQSSSGTSTIGTLMGIALAIGGSLYLGFNNLTLPIVADEEVAQSPISTPMLQPIQEPILNAASTENDNLQPTIASNSVQNRLVSTDRQSAYPGKYTAPVQTDDDDLDPQITPTLQSSQRLFAAQDLEVDRKAPRCKLHGNGELIGYWYIGAQAPEIINNTTVVPGGRNVRLDYPRADNGYNTRAPIRCVLFANTVVSIQEAPIFVEGNRYWVALYSQSNG